MSNVHWGPHAVSLCDRMEQKRSHARHPGGRCSGRKTWGVWPPTLPRRCPQTSVPQQFPHPLSPWGRFRVMVSIVKPTGVVSPINISSPGGRLGAEEDSHSSRYSGSRGSDWNRDTSQIWALLTWCKKKRVEEDNISNNQVAKTTSRY